jgi:hypothetical protein
MSVPSLRTIALLNAGSLAGRCSGSSSASRWADLLVDQVFGVLGTGC